MRTQNKMLLVQRRFCLYAYAHTYMSQSARFYFTKKNKNEVHTTEELVQ